MDGTMVDKSVGYWVILLVAMWVEERVVWMDGMKVAW